MLQFSVVFEKSDLNVKCHFYISFELRIIATLLFFYIYFVLMLLYNFFKRI